MTFTNARNAWKKYYLLPLVGLALFTTFPALAAGTTAGTTIDNTAQGSFENPNNPGVVIPVDSNTVTLTISEVAGIAVSNQGLPTEAPAAEVVNDGPSQGDMVISSEDVVYFTYRITNVGNDQTQFFIPDAPANVDNAVFQTANPIEIVEYFDGITVTPLSIDVTAGAVTGTFTAIPNDGSIPVDGYIDVRVPVKVNSGLTPGVDVTVVLGNTVAPPGPSQNVQLDNGGEFGVGNNVNTVDNADGDGIAPGDLAGGPAFEREASSSQTTTIDAATLDYGDAPDAAAGTATGDYESAPGRGPSHVVSAAPTIFLGTTNTVDTETTFAQDGPAEDDAVVVNDGVTNPSLHNETFIAGQTYTWDVETHGAGELTIWVDFDGDGDFEDDGPLPRVTSTGATESVNVTVPLGATGGATYARVRYSSQTNLTSTSAAPDGEVEDYAITIDAAAPALRLVKRVTRVGATNFTAFVDDTGDTDDDAANWPPDAPGPLPYLAGAIAANAEPGEQVDYTVYFLSDGNTPVNNIKFCDLIPANTTYVADSLRVNLGNAGEQTLTDASGAEPVVTDAVGEKFADGAVPANSPCPVPGVGMDQGGVYVEIVGTADNATAPGTPTSSFGYIRFTVQVN